jgi:leucyl aminopeptidase (aminopeptidase T)
MNLNSVRFARTARKIVEVNAHVQADEKVGIVTDTNRISIAEALMAAANAVGADPVMLIMNPRQKHSEEPPPVLAAAMKSADVLIMPTTYALSHCQATRAALAAGTRIMGLREVTEDTFLNGAITADYEEIYTFTNRLADAMVPGSTVRMTTALGSDITMSKKGQFVLRSAGLMRGDVRFTGLPTGEAAFTPVDNTAEGVIIVDQAIDNIGLLKEPVKVTVKKGKIVKIEGGSQARRLEEYVFKNENGDNIAELAIGTNPKSRLLGNVAEDKCLRGAVHIGIGSNLLLRGNIVSPIHFDLVILKPTVTMDGKELVRDGQVLP